MIAVAVTGIAIWALRLSHRDLLLSYELSLFGLMGLSPILICYLWLRGSTDQKPSMPVETLIARFAAVITVGVVLWGVFALCVAPFN